MNLHAKSLSATTAVLCAVLASPPSVAAEAMTVDANQVKWGDAPPSMPKGAKIAVIMGDPSKAGPFVLRFRAPANYRIPAHWHSQPENLTVLSGAFHLGMGDKFDAKKVHVLKPGSFHYLPGKTNHYAFTKTPTVLQLHGEGPFDLNYVNPDDNPEKKTAKQP
jgi:hypothetical protein